MSEGAENETSGGPSGGVGGGMGGPNVRGGPTSGATRLTDSANNSGFNTQSCQC